jgi:hypothetical protein
MNCRFKEDWGDKVDLNHGGQKNNPVVSQMTLPEHDKQILEHWLKTKGNPNA